MNFFTPNDSSIAAFIIILLVVIGFVWNAFQTAFGGGFKKAIILYFVWLIILSGFVLSGIIIEKPVPFLLIYFLISNLSALVFALSPYGKKIAEQVPIQYLILFHSFRLPLEIILHSWANQGTIPETMTWTGENIDIISGLAAIVAFFLYNKLSKTKAYIVARIFNVIGFALLLNVMRVAMLSSNLPFAWKVFPPLQLANSLPYSLIIPVCVSGALAGHIILMRAFSRK